MEDEREHSERKDAEGDGRPSELDMEPFEAQFAQEFKRPPRRAPRHGGSMMMAAMIGIAEALGMDPEPTEVTQPAAQGNEPELDLSFGDLPPLD